MTSTGPVTEVPPDVEGVQDATTLLSLRDLRVHFRTERGIVHAVDGVSLDIGDGEAVGLVGETGSGKTVTARSLMRLIPTPPGIYAGGEALFRPRIACSACAGGGCDICQHTGYVPDPCPNCDGPGCAHCRQSGRRTLDMLTVNDRVLRTIRGDNIAMIFQDPNKALNPNLSVRQQLAEVFTEHRSDELLRGAGLDGLSSVALRRAASGKASFFERRVLQLPPLGSQHRRLQAVLDEHIVSALADTHVPNPGKIMHRFPHELSGGMKQRVMIALALACDPDLLIADEPTTALDVTIQARILDLIAELQERHRAAVLYISHDLSIVREICDRVAVLYAGRIAEVGPTERIYSEPLHPYTRGLLGAIPGFGQRRGELVPIDGTVPELIEPTPCCRFHTRCPHEAPVCERVEPELHPVHPHGEGLAACFLYEQAGPLGVEPHEMPSAEGAELHVPSHPVNPDGEL